MCRMCRLDIRKILSRFHLPVTIVGCGDWKITFSSTGQVGRFLVGAGLVEVAGPQNLTNRIKRPGHGAVVDPRAATF